MQGKIFAIPYEAWIAAFVFDVLIIIDSYPAALLLFLLLSYHSYKKFFLKQAGTYKILICLGGEIFLSLLCILTISTLNPPLSTDQTTLLFFHPAACCNGLQISQHPGRPPGNQSGNGLEALPALSKIAQAGAAGSRDHLHH